ncbi:hypothetical protein BDF19DRAFT_452246 [Syncephalis fuscata]|nr:hypothetical protein BDF19DRAFT_452246 [Syncephalis fuscata]
MSPISQSVSASTNYEADTCESALSQLSIVETATTSGLSTPSNEPDSNWAEEDEEDDEFGEFEYAPLADSEDEGKDDQISADNSTVHLSSFTVPKPVEPIPEEDVQLIKQVMSRFQFPEHAIPAWAKYIPEQAWLPKVKEVPMASDQ